MDLQLLLLFLELCVLLLRIPAARTLKRCNLKVFPSGCILQVPCKKAVSPMTAHKFDVNSEQAVQILIGELSMRIKAGSLSAPWVTTGTLWLRQIGLAFLKWRPHFTYNALGSGLLQKLLPDDLKLLHMQPTKQNF